MAGRSSSHARADALPPDEIAPRFALVERRLTAQALDCWLARPDRPVPGFSAHSLMVLDPGGRAWIETVGAALAAISGLVPGQRLERGPGLAGEFAAACDLLALQPMSVPFEAHLAPFNGPGIMLRGIALPIGTRPGSTRHGSVARAQIICNWREILNQAATLRLRRELCEALRLNQPLDRPDPFPRRR